MSTASDFTSVKAALTQAMEDHLNMGQTRLNQCKEAVYRGFIQYRHHPELAEPHIREAYLFQGMAEVHLQAHENLSVVSKRLEEVEPAREFTS